MMLVRRRRDLFLGLGGRRLSTRKRLEVCSEADLLAEKGEVVEKRRRRLPRVRHHINVLSGLAAMPIELENEWFLKRYESIERRLTVDVGCARGGYCLKSAQLYRDRNFLGLEVHPTAHKISIERLIDQGLKEKNCAFLKANVNFDFDRILEEASQYSVIDQILIQFPDPHFKKKHHKRRMVTPKFAQRVAETLVRAQATASPPHNLPHDFFVYFATDVIEVAEEMFSIFSDHTPLIPASAPQGEGDRISWLDSSPLSVATEREEAVLDGLGETSTIRGHVFRSLFTVPPPST